MHIYRFFQPHHNPRLLCTGIRQLELSELETAASELAKAIERALQRTKRKAVAPIMPEHFTDVLRAIRFVEQSLQTLCDAHPGDNPDVLLDMIHERRNLVGWEGWTSLLEEQLVTNDSGEAILQDPDPNNPLLIKVEKIENGAAALVVKKEAA